MTYTKESLVAFSERVKEAFLAKRIKSPVHLCDPAQAEPLIAIFKDVRPQDWLFCSWRNMFHCLLKGMPEEELFQAILEGQSMYVMSREHRIVCSSIVGGILPIACGVAMGIKRSHDKFLKDHPHINNPKPTDWSSVWCFGPGSKVWVFVGDATARTGLFHEFEQYCLGHMLPVRIIIEDNGLSTNADTAETWGREGGVQGMIRYHYKRSVPHVGVGQHVEF